MSEAAVLAQLLPPTVRVEETTTDAPSSVLLPEEMAAIGAAVPKRVAEYATVRACARRALARLGQPAVPIIPGRNREPQWPVGIVGSLTHCDGYRAAAVAWSGEVASLGIDAEVNQPLPEGVAALVTVGDESRMLAALTDAGPAVAWDRLLFSAKESIYKTWYPLTGRWLDFTECELVIDAAAGSFSGRLLVPGPVLGGRTVDAFDGRWVVSGRHVLTGVVVPTAGAPGT